MADSSKTEKATSTKRKQAREQGDFPRSRDASGVMACVAAVLALCSLGPPAADRLHAFAMQCFRDPMALTSNRPTPVVQQAIGVLSHLVLPSAIAAALGAVAIGFAQAGFLPQVHLIAPKLERLDPSNKLKSMFGLGHALVEMTQSLLRVAAIGWVVYAGIVDVLPQLIKLSGADVPSATRLVASSVGGLALRATGALAVLAAADFGVSKLQWEQRNMMTKQEVRDEFKRQEGNQQVKAQMRAIARSRLKRGLVKQIKQSDVVLANPTHISVALRYRAREGAPVVMAKGYDEIAMYIRELAREAKVPIVENRLLARALASKVKVGKTIPVELYAAVAEVLAFVYRLRGRVIM